MATSKKNKGGKPKGVKLKGVKQKFMREYPGQDPKFVFHPDAKPDPEEAAPEPGDEAAKHAYPPPRKETEFRRVWMEFIDNVTSRENFKRGHLNSLEILCDLFVEYNDIQKFIRRKGRSYLSKGRSGDQWKFYPEVAQLGRVQTQIAQYMKMLGLVLKKDNSEEDGDAKGEWK